MFWKKKPTSIREQYGQVLEQADQHSQAERTSVGVGAHRSVLSMPTDHEIDEASRSLHRSPVDTGVVFGEIIAILARTPHYSRLSLSDLNWAVAPLIRTRQFKLAIDQKKSGIFPSAVGLAAWAWVDPLVDLRLSSNSSEIIKLAPNDWNSGDLPWLIDIIGDDQTCRMLFENVRDEVFKGKPFKFRRRKNQEEFEVAVIQ